MDTPRLPSFRILGLALAASLMVPLASLHANIVSVPDVDGLTAFQDTNTGLVWLGLNNFFNESPADQLVTAEAAGFSLADTGQVNFLLNSLPLDGGQWSTYASIMGSAPNRGLIWGDYSDASYPGQQEWAYAYSGDTSWSYELNDGPMTFIPNGGGPYADLNLWAVQTGNSQVPDAAPTALILGVALLGLAVMRRRLGAVSA